MAPVLLLMTRNTPRIQGWMRQKNVYVPGASLVGVLPPQLFPTAGVPSPS